MCPRICFMALYYTTTQFPKHLTKGDKFRSSSDHKHLTIKIHNSEKPAVDKRLPQRRLRYRSMRCLLFKDHFSINVSADTHIFIHKAIHIYVYVVAKVYWRLMYTLAPKFEANVYISPKLQTWRLMCTLSPNLEAKVNWYM